MQDNSITLCMIVKDEEYFLRASLQSIAGEVDRMIVVDTGSTDDSVDIAKECGADVYHFEWCDDFAAARNFALSKVKTAWSITMDADEIYCSPPGYIKKALQPHIFNGYVHMYRAHTLEETCAEALTHGATLLPRLHQIKPGMKWVGCVHEIIDYFDDEATHIPVDLRFVHYGCVTTYRDARGKNERNLALLEKRLDQDPTCVSTRTYLTCEYIRCGQFKKSREVGAPAWKQVYEHNKAQEPNGPFRKFVTLVTSLAELEIIDGDALKGINLLEQTLPWGQPHPNVIYMAIKGNIVLSDDDRRRAELAEQLCLKLLTLDGRSFDEEIIPGTTSWLCYAMLANARFKLGNFRQAYDDMQRAIDMVPHHNVAMHVGQIDCVLQLGFPVVAMGRLEPLLSSRQSAAWELMARCCQELGYDEHANRYMEMVKHAGT